MPVFDRKAAEEALAQANDDVEQDERGDPDDVNPPVMTADTISPIPSPSVLRYAAWRKRHE